MDNKRKKKILFTGGSGLLALNCAWYLQHSHEVVLGMHLKNVFLNGIQTFTIHLETIESFRNDLQTIRPDIVIHCAGLANVEASEADPAAAYRINAVLAENVAIACKEQNISLVHISTDHLFDGDKPLVTEDEQPSPVNEYGKTKWQGEQKVLAVSAANLVIRTNFYGFGTSYRHSFSDMIVDNARNKQPLFLFDDFYYTPILIEELADTVISLLDNSAGGIYHVVGNERISKYEFGFRLLSYYKLDTGLITATKFAERKDLVKRPGDLSLSNAKTSAALNKQIGNIDKNIARLYEQEQNGLSQIMNSI